MLKGGRPDVPTHDADICTPTDFTAWITNYNAGC